MLEELIIKNAELDLEFQDYIYEYTVTAKEDITFLDFDYKLSEGSTINIRDNQIKDIESVIYIDTIKDGKMTTYTFHVYKDNSEEVVSGINDFVNSIEIAKSETVEVYKVQILAISVFLIIVLLYAIIFRKKVIK